MLSYVTCYILLKYELLAPNSIRLNQGIDITVLVSAGKTRSSPLCLTCTSSSSWCWWRFAAVSCPLAFCQGFLPLRNSCRLPVPSVSLFSGLPRSPPHCRIQFHLLKLPTKIHSYTRYWGPYVSWAMVTPNSSLSIATWADMGHSKRSCHRTNCCRVSPFECFPRFTGKSLTRTAATEGRPAPPVQSN